MIHEVKFHEMDSTGKPVHEYSVAGMKVPYVTYVLDRRGFCNYQDCPEDYMEAARERGQIGHEVTHWFDEQFKGILVSNNLTEYDYVSVFETNCLSEPLHPWSREILSAWVNFRKDFEFVPLVIEKPMAWQINGMMVCGTPDRFGTSKIGNMVIDLKFTAKVEASCKYQLAGYAANPELWHRGLRPLRYVAHFRDGKVIPVCYTRTKDERMFAAALAITHDLWNGGSK